MTGQQTAIETARGLMDNGMSAAQANVEVVRMMGVRLVEAKMQMETRRALMDGVKAGKLGHLKKDGLKPEAFFHPNSEASAKESRNKAANASIQAIARVMA